MGFAVTTSLLAWVPLSWGRRRWILPVENMYWLCVLVYYLVKSCSLEFTPLTYHSSSSQCCSTYLTSIQLVLTVCFARASPTITLIRVPPLVWCIMSWILRRPMQMTRKGRVTETLWYTAAIVYEVPVAVYVMYMEKVSSLGYRVTKVRACRISMSCFISKSLEADSN